MIIDENYIEKLCNTVAKTILEVFENLSIEDVNMYKLGYNKAIDDVIKSIDDICDTERDRCNDFGCCSDCYKSGIKEMAEQLNSKTKL
jgi:hypothetical protein